MRLQKYRQATARIATSHPARVRALLVSVLFGCTTVPCLADKLVFDIPLRTPAEEEFSRGRTALTEGKLQAAETSFTKTLELNPKDVDALLGLAKLAIIKGKTDAAAGYLKRAVSVAPSNANVQTTWGHYLFWQKRYSEAELAFKKAIDLSPHVARPHIELGDLYLSGFHQPRPAIQEYRAAVDIEPGNARVHYTLANALAQAGEADDAQGHIEYAAKLDPDNPVIYESLGDFLIRRKRTDQALEAYAKALSVDRSYLPAHMARGQVFAELGQFDKALAEYEAAVKVQPKFAPAYTEMGVVHQRNSDPDQAEKAYRTAITLDPKQAIAYNNLAWLSAERRTRLDQALVWAKKAVDLVPNAPTFQDTLGWVYRAKGQLGDAVSVLKKAAALKPQNPEILYHLGVVYSEAGRNKDAALAFSEALTLDPAFSGAEDARRRLAALKDSPG